MVRVRSCNEETGYLRGRRTGERGGKRDGLRMERNSSSASEGKLDLVRREIGEENIRRAGLGRSKTGGWT
jgi:hypothetical protein